MNMRTYTQTYRHASTAHTNREIGTHPPKVFSSTSGDNSNRDDANRITVLTPKLTPRLPDHSSSHFQYIPAQ